MLLRTKGLYAGPLNLKSYGTSWMRQTSVRSLFHVAQIQAKFADVVLFGLNLVVDDAPLHRTTQSRKLLYSLDVKSFWSTASYNVASARIQTDSSDCVALLEPSSRGAFVLFLDKNDTDELNLVMAESIFDWITPTLVFLIKVDAKAIWSDHAHFVARLEAMVPTLIVS